MTDDKVAAFDATHPRLSRVFTPPGPRARRSSLFKTKFLVGATGRDLDDPLGAPFPHHPQPHGSVTRQTATSRRQASGHQPDAHDSAAGYLLMDAEWAFREARAERRTKLRRDSSRRVEPGKIPRRVIIKLVVRLQAGSR
jgi:hypothetical protein